MKKDRLDFTVTFIGNTRAIANAYITNYLITY